MDDNLNELSATISLIVLFNNYVICKCYIEIEKVGKHLIEV